MGHPYRYKGGSREACARARRGVVKALRVVFFVGCRMALVISCVSFATAAVQMLLLCFQARGADTDGGILQSVQVQRQQYSLRRTGIALN